MLRIVLKTWKNSEMDEDEELQVLMDFVLGPETEDEDSS